jgi:hypothetical protein
MDFTPKRVGESEVLTVDFVDLLGVGETILSASWNMRVKAGVDPAANSMIQGTATTTGTKVSQMVTAGVAGVLYEPLCTALTSLGQTVELPDPGEGLLMVVE